MIDITRALYPGHPVWPGDSDFSLTLVSKIAEGDSVNVMKLVTTTHLGTHLDAPFHYLQDGPRLKEVPLTLLVGEAQVIHVPPGPVTPQALNGLGALPERVLFFTGQPARWEAFPHGFAPLTPELVTALHEWGVKLVGTDSPSVDEFNSKDLPVHQIFAEHGMIILEGLDLSQVQPGRFELICLPLRLEEADASPVRALLRPLPQPQKP